MATSDWTFTPARGRGAWALLRLWMGRHDEAVWQRAVLQPAHELACELLSDRSDAWDVTIEAFEVLLDTLSRELLPALAGDGEREHLSELGRLLGQASVDGEPLLLAYLRTRLRRDTRVLALARLHNAARLGRQRPLSADRGPSREAAEAVPFDRDPVGEAERHELVVAVRTALAGLTRKTREAQELAMDGLSQRQIASRLQLSRGAVRWRLEQASQLLHDKLDGAYGLG